MIHIVGVDVVSFQQATVAGALHSKLQKQTQRHGTSGRFEVTNVARHELQSLPAASDPLQTVQHSDTAAVQTHIAWSLSPQPLSQVWIQLWAARRCCVLKCGGGELSFHTAGWRLDSRSTPSLRRSGESLLQVDAQPWTQSHVHWKCCMLNEVPARCCCYVADILLHVSVSQSFGQTSIHTDTHPAVKVGHQVRRALPVRRQLLL